eukprot:g1662.t1
MATKRDSGLASCPGVSPRTPDVAPFAVEPGLLPPPRCRPLKPLEAMREETGSRDSSEELETQVEAPSIILEIGGSGAKDLPAERRLWGPITLGNDPYIIGRRHQKEFLQRTVREECLDFISRDHFGIAYRNKTFILLALSQNRISLDLGKVLGIRRGLCCDWGK